MAKGVEKREEEGMLNKPSRAPFFPPPFAMLDRSL